MLETDQVNLFTLKSRDNTSNIDVDKNNVELNSCDLRT